ncbi:MAG: hypothetical protein R3F11_21605 [Verrucomicrobiales bacterium]
MKLYLTTFVVTSLACHATFAEKPKVDEKLKPYESTSGVTGSLAPSDPIRSTT